MSFRLLLCAVALAVLPQVGCEKGNLSKTPDGSDHALMGVVAPPVELKSVNGGEISASSFKGKVVLLDFWATWCEPCRDSFPVYQSLADEYQGKVLFVGVSVDPTADPIPAFLEETGAKFPVVWDGDQTLAKAYQPPAMPSTFVVDREGIVRHIHEGYRPGDEDELRRQIAELL